ncbi:hypothetical protein [Pseudomonas sp. MPC6]|jgi:hypothetical protein|uniref:hypothetical protein n=1 Tax=unclassified Pseudomonas TaxID=196821 RepID=UPI00111088DF|nr:hypothetical protein [Pseudomonas sp. MPC6]QCY12934.1 hypothetical protein ELQ88_20340 [Pseudomonas sp. MPC6]
MDVTVLVSGYVDLAQPSCVTKMFNQMCWRAVDARHGADGQFTIAFSELICIENINGVQHQSYGVIGKGTQGRSGV